MTGVRWWELDLTVRTGEEVRTTVLVLVTSASAEATITSDRRSSTIPPAEDRAA
jgi:hypothetical protein